MNILIRVGEGRSQSGKILDRDTQWYLYRTDTGKDERLDAVRYARATGKKIYTAVNGRKYRETTIEELLSYGKTEN